MPLLVYPTYNIYIYILVAEPESEMHPQRGVKKKQ